MSESPNGCARKALGPFLYADRYVRTLCRFYFAMLKSVKEGMISFYCFPEKAGTYTNTWAFWMALRSRHHLSHFGALSPPHDKMAACSLSPAQTRCASSGLVPSAPSPWLQERCLHLPAGPALGFNIRKVKKSVREIDILLLLSWLLFKDALGRQL